ncbi:hypothetical protein SAMN00017477_0275 [Peptoniphilus asaccharolyticus DSM 20463]|uniref:Uncharacterized protein n=1 Tax=Peptoniphilus asaccharolyticus DSM 20463 TaxID=573058 RepID=A0A1W1UI44_PEPAS|nr:DUF5412 family protein [Peptoniphilus asaccharolyticus]MBL7574756.1 hypothetical protein [Peptoniphilus asaccharolyticus]SMB80740.1 hypothetical protein SAMN00017477_0275 [Peptoniphilus asaccharolyticus DSM 20463]
MKKFYIIFLIGISTTILFFTLIYLYFLSPIIFFVEYDPENIIGSYSSPNRKNVINFYLKNGGSLSHDSVVGTYSSLDENENEIKFFFEYPCFQVNVKEWYDEDTVLLEWYDPQIETNKTLKIDFKKSLHHFRKH